MPYLFDTDVLTTLLKPNPPKVLIDRLLDLSIDQQFTSTITISEIVYGAHKSHRPNFHLRNLEEVLLPAVNIVDFDAAAAYRAGLIRAELERKGTPLAFADLQIAGIAQANDFILVTGNVAHFGRIPDLHVENWLL